jgi:hypothetical protein
MGLARDPEKTAIGPPSGADTRLFAKDSCVNHGAVQDLIGRRPDWR